MVMNDRFLIAAHDAILSVRISEALHERSRSRWEHLQIDVRHGKVTLQGRLSSFYERQLVIAAVRQVTGVLQVDDRLLVAEHGPKSSRPATSDREPTTTSHTTLAASNPKDRRWHLSWLGLILLLMVGCQKKALDRPAVFPVSGQVIQLGKPLANALVVLHPRQAKDPRVIAARATTDAEGRFRCTTFEHEDGAAPGSYAVTIRHHPLIKHADGFSPGPNSLPKKLADPRSSPIVVEIAAGPNLLTPFDVRR